MQRFPLITLVASVVLAASGQLLLKLGATGPVRTLEFVNLQLVTGLVCYAAGAVLWIYALSVAPLYLVYPFTMVTFVLVGAGSYFILGEQPGALSIAGWLVTLVGISLITLGALK